MFPFLREFITSTKVPEEENKENQDRGRSQITVNIVLILPSTFYLYFFFFSYLFLLVVFKHLFSTINPSIEFRFLLNFKMVNNSSKFDLW